MTSDYFKNHAVNQTKIRSLNGDSVSALAVGTYLGDCDDPTDRLYEEALVFAGQNGINFFDTAINYRAQRSERAIGYAIRKLAGLGVSRAELVVSTKGGFLPANGDPHDLKSYVLKTFLNTGVISPDDIVANCHCMTPDYLKMQLELSLDNLKLDFVDVYYVHNPETQLSAVSEDMFYDRLTQAFEMLEEQARQKKIGCYGMATWNGFRVPRGVQGYLDLERIIECAQKAGGDTHHFGAIQLPYNLAMLEAVALREQKVKGEPMPIIAAATMQNIAVMVSAPLMQSHVLELPQEFYGRMPGELTPSQKSLLYVVSSPGVVSAMVGMKQLKHVQENIQVLQQDNWELTDLQEISRLLVRE